MKVQSVDIERVVMIRINSGEDILTALRKAVGDEGIHNGMIINGLGSSQSHHYHVVASNELPPAEAFTISDQPRDIVSLSGLIIDGRVHAHISFTDDKRGEGGHLEPGTKALTFAIIAIADFGDSGSGFTDWDSIKEL